MKVINVLIIIFFLFFQIGCDKNDTSSAQLTLYGEIIGLEFGNSIIINNGQETITLTENGDFSFRDLFEVNSSYVITIVEPPVGFVCYIKNKTGTYKEINNQQRVGINCVKNKSSLNILTSDSSEVDLIIHNRNFPENRLSQSLFNETRFLDFFGTATDSISTVAGLFITDSFTNVYYGVTRSGTHI